MTDIALLKVYRGFDICCYTMPHRKGIAVYIQNQTKPIHTCDTMAQAIRAIDIFHQETQPPTGTVQ